MRSNGQSFSDCYSRMLEMHKQLGEDLEEHLFEWSRDIINTLGVSFQEATFKVVVSMEPNSPDCKGIDSARIEVWQTAAILTSNSVLGPIPFTPFVKIMSSNHSNLADCINDVNERMDMIVKSHDDTKAGIIQMGDKKFKLVEIK